MATFRKKPVEVEAMQWDGTMAGYERIRLWCPVVQHRSVNMLGLLFVFVIIPTLEGEMQASPDDWIIRGVKGEFYPCKPDIFAATYEPVAAVAAEEQVLASSRANPGEQT